MNSLPFLTVGELAPLIESKQLSPIELTQAVLRRIEELNPIINAYITVTPEIALEQARHAEQEIMNGQYKGPLHGIPIGIKDNYYTKGIPTTGGSSVFRDFIPDETATAVKKLACAGTITLGKLNMHELGGGITNTNYNFGYARNPWDLNRSPGGSSGGSSAALAAGLATIATGTDTFGSIRVPAAMCGIYGLKPTYGLISTHGVMPLAQSMDHGGPMARSVKDIAIMLKYLAGYDPNDPGSVKAPVHDYMENLSKGVKDLIIGIPGYLLSGLEPDVELSFKQAIQRLEALGARIREMNVPELEMTSYAAYVTVTAEASNNYIDVLQITPESLDSDVRIFFESGIITSSNQYLIAQKARRKLTEAVKKVFEEVDVLAAPMIPITAPVFQADYVEQNLELIKRCMPFVAPATLTGIPSLSVPIGVSSEGLPMGMQILGNHLNEKLLLQVGSTWENTNPLGGKYPI